MAITVVVLAAIVVGFLVVTGGEDKGYLVRGVFDNGGFIVEGEDVRIAGANVGSVDSVTVSMPGEVVSHEGGQDKVEPGKAVVVMRIDDPGFQDFKTDGHCLIRPQSLLGEKYIDCEATMPRAPGSPAPPDIPAIPDGQPGAGQHLLPLENNGKTVDLDLINDISRKPYAERFRLILSDLGAGLAARGPDLAHIVERGNPALQQTNKVLGILAEQSNDLAQLADDSDKVLRPLTAARQHFAGFIRNSGEAAQASAERGEELEAAFNRFPVFLGELEKTMTKFQRFSDSGLPIATDFNQAGEDLAKATQKLTPFLGRSTTALNALGDASRTAGPLIQRSYPLVDKTYKLGTSGAEPLQNSAAFLGSLRDTKGFDNLMDLIYNTLGSYNGFDDYGHFLRSLVTVTNCNDHVNAPYTGCSGLYNPAEKAPKKKKKKKKKKKAKKSSLSNRSGLAGALQNLTPVPQPTQAKPAPDAPTSTTGGTGANQNVLDYLFGQ